MAEAVVGGTLDETAMYSAAGSVGSIQVVATSVANTSRRGPAAVNGVVPSSVDPTGLIPPERVTAWRPGVTYNGGIPHRTTACKTVTPRGAGLDDADQINAAIEACPDNQVVMLGPGTFNLLANGSRIRFRRNNITLRGTLGSSGELLSRIVKAASANSGAIEVGPVWYSGAGTAWIGQTAFTRDAAKGANSVTVASNPGLKVGELVHVNETYDPTLTWFHPSRQTNDYLGWGENRKGTQAASRPVGQAMVIESITGSAPSITLTFTTPFHTNFRVSKSAHLARISDGGRPVQPTYRVGVEDLYCAGGAGGDWGGNFLMFVAHRSWFRNVESDRSGGAGVLLDGCVQCELRDSYIHSTTSPAPGGGGYGIVIDRYAADNLVENNISWNFNKVMAMRGSGGGNVIGYNYMEDGWGQGYPNISETGLNAAHMTTPHMELFEGNQSFNFDGDSTWGNSIYVTVFRNHLTGKRRSVSPLSFVDTGNRRAIGLTINHWWYTFLGNVLGSAGQVAGPGYSSLIYDWLGNSVKAVPMWQLGYNGETWNQYDRTVFSRSIRHGNFDYVTNGVVWDSAIMRRDLPPSLYLSAKPSFFGSNPWPWVTPETPASPVATLPARARFDSMPR